MSSAGLVSMGQMSSMGAVCGLDLAPQYLIQCAGLIRCGHHECPGPCTMCSAWVQSKTHTWHRGLDDRAPRAIFALNQSLNLTVCVVSKYIKLQVGQMGKGKHPRDLPEGYQITEFTFHKKTGHHIPEQKQ